MGSKSHEIHSLTPGARVTCAYRAGHVGTVLAIDDVDAWRGTLAFLDRECTPQTARAHVAYLRERYGARWHGDRESVPVRYPWGVMWDRASALSLA